MPANGENIGSVSVSVIGDWSQLQRDLDAASGYAAKAASQIASAFSSAGKAAAGIGTGFDAAAAGAYNFSKGAAEIVNKQKELDRELIIAKGALVDIRLAYEQGAASANALSRAEEQVKQASAAANLALRDVNKAAQEAAAASAKAAQEVEESWRRAGQSLTTIGIGLTAAVTAPLVAGFKEAVTESNKFGLAMHEVASIMDSSTEASFKALSGQVLDLSVKLGVDATKAARGLYEALSANIPQENAISFLEVATKASIAGLTNTKVAVDGLTSVLNAFHLQTTETTKVADAMFVAIKLGKFRFDELSASMAKAMPIAAQVGVSFQEVLAAAATITKSGVPVSEAFTEIQRAITSLIAPSKEMKALFEEMGVASGKDLLAQEGLVGALQKVRDAAGDEEGAIFKAMRRMEGFRALLGLTGENLEGAKKDLDEVTNSAGRMDVAFQEIEKSGARGFDHLKASMEALAITAGDALAPALGKIVKNMEPLIKGLIDAVKWFGDLDPVVQQTAITLGAMAAAAGPLALLGAGFVRIREAARLASLAFADMAVGLNVLKGAGWLAVITSLAVLTKAIYDYKVAKDSLNKSNQEETDGLAKLEITLRQAGVNISELSDQYNHGLLSFRDYMRELNRLAVEHGNAVRSSKELSDTQKKLNLDLTNTGTAGEAAAVGVGKVSTSAKESKNSIDSFLESYEKLFATPEKIQSVQDIADAIRMIGVEAMTSASAIGEDLLPALQDGLNEAMKVANEQVMEAAKNWRLLGFEIAGLEPPIAEVTEKTKTMGETTITYSTRSKDAMREVRQAINGISEGIANAIVHWKGFQEAGIAVLEAIGKAILKNVIQQILDATGLVDKLVAAIGKVLAKVGLDAATGAAGSAASTASGGAASAGSGVGSAAGGLSSLSSIIGLAGVGVSAASGIVNGIQNARMENLLSGIEISTRATKEQITGGTQEVLNRFLPKLDYLLDIWKAINAINDQVRYGVVQTRSVEIGAPSASPNTGPFPTNPATGMPDYGGQQANSVKGRGPSISLGSTPPGFTGSGFPGMGGTTEFAFAPGFELNTGGTSGGSQSFSSWLSSQNFQNVEPLIAYLKGTGVTDTQLFQSLAKFGKGFDFAGWTPGSSIITGKTTQQGLGGSMQGNMYDPSMFPKVVGNLAGSASPMMSTLGPKGNDWSNFSSSSFLQNYYQQDKEKRLAEYQQAIGYAQDQLQAAQASGNTANIAYYTQQISALKLAASRLSSMSVSDAPGRTMYEVPGMPSLSSLKTWASGMSSTPTSYGGNYDMAPVNTQWSMPSTSGGRSSQGGSIPIVINAFDPAARAIGRGVIDVLQDNGIYR